MAATVIIIVALIKGKAVERPKIRSPKELMAIEIGLPMEQSVRRDYADLILGMEEEYRIPRWDEFNLVTQVGEISVGYVNISTVAAQIALEYVEAAAEDCGGCLAYE